MLVDSTRITEPHQHQKRHKPRPGLGLSPSREADWWLPHPRDARSQTASMGDTGFEPRAPPSENLRISRSGNADFDAPGEVSGSIRAGSGSGGLLEALSAGQDAQTELMSIARALLELDPQALRALGAVISLLKTSTANGP
jgi:hypothetical protein